jgi:hypothetical protein
MATPSRSVETAPQIIASRFDGEGRESPVRAEEVPYRFPWVAAVEAAGEFSGFSERGTVMYTSKKDPAL